MSLITWTQQQFGTGVSAHDQEHQHIFSLLNTLHDAVGAGDRKKTGAALDALIAFVANHFASEEGNMDKAAYLDLGRHKQEHDKLVQTCLDLQKQFRDGRVEVTAQTTAFLRDWLVEHIPQIDRQYGAPMNAAGIR